MKTRNMEILPDIHLGWGFHQYLHVVFQYQDEGYGSTEDLFTFQADDNPRTRESVNNSKQDGAESPEGDQLPGSTGGRRFDKPLHEWNATLLGASVNHEGGDCADDEAGDLEEQLANSGQAASSAAQPQPIRNQQSYRFPVDDQEQEYSGISSLIS